MKTHVNKTSQREDEVVKKIVERVKHLRNVRGLPQKAVQTLEAFMRLLPARKRRADLYLLLANLYVDTGKSRRAKAAFRTAARKAKQARNNVLLADILRKWGYLYLHTNPNLKDAQKLITESIRLIEQEIGMVVSSNEREVTRQLLNVAANCHASLGNLEQTKGDLSEAKSAYEKALWYAESSGAKERAVTVMGDLGSIALSEKNWKEAERLLLEARNRAERYYQHALPAALLRLGRLYASPENPEHNPAQAEAFFKESLQVAKKGGWKREEADALRALGEKEKADRIYRSIGYHAHLAK